MSRRSAAHVSAEAYQAASRVVARREGLAAQFVMSPSGLRARRARRLAVYLAAIACGRSMWSLAQATGLDRKTLREAFAQIEEWRDDPQFDAHVAALETEVLDAA